MSDMLAITLTVNGVDYPVAVAQDRNLLSVIRTEVGLTGTKEGSATTASAEPAWCCSTASP